MASNNALDDEVEDLIAQIDRETNQQVEGSTDSESNDEPDPHDDFCHLLTLLILAAAYNSDGVPCLKNTVLSNQNLDSLVLGQHYNQLKLHPKVY